MLFSDFTTEWAISISQGAWYRLKSYLTNNKCTVGTASVTAKTLWLHVSIRVVTNCTFYHSEVYFSVINVDRTALSYCLAVANDNTFDIYVPSSKWPRSIQAVRNKNAPLSWRPDVPSYPEKLPFPVFFINTWMKVMKLWVALNVSNVAKNNSQQDFPVIPLLEQLCKRKVFCSRTLTVH